MSRVGSSYPSLVVMVFDFVLKNGHNYYQQVFLKELKYIEKKEKGDQTYYWWTRNFFWWFWWKIVFL